MSPPVLPPAADDVALALPARPTRTSRPGVPWLASAVPVVGALAMWAATGSPFALWFAVLGPLIAGASVLDGARTARRERRVAEADGERVRADVAQRVAARQSVERETRRARHPDLGGFLAHPEQIWRPVRVRQEHLVVGAGAVPSEVRVSAAGGHPEDAALVSAARMLPDAPVLLPLIGGIAIVGPAPFARAVARALVLQLACTHPPGALEIAAGPEPWVGALPHARPGRLRVGWAAVDEPVPEGDVVLVERRAGDAVPAGCAAVLELTAPGHARCELAGTAEDLAVEAVAAVQAAAIAAELAARAATHGDSDDSVALSAVTVAGRAEGREALPVAIGLTGREPFVIDLVHDGPHALVTGMTGAGKSELLVTWVTALCRRYRTNDVAFLLADFKGGTAFDALAELPHVTGVLTDLDDAGAARAIASLRAEVRARETRLAAVQERDIVGTDLPRLVVVVDEFAALRESHPDLEALFADLAARGRALGVHLILGTQRAAGVFRESLMANCPLRVSLRVADAADSTAMLGEPAAASLPGGTAGRGQALVRRSADTRTIRIRVALTDAGDRRAAADDAGPPPRPPWLPALPASLPLSRIVGAGAPVLGLIDDPQFQRQEAWVLDDSERGLLVVGGAGAGKTTVLRTIAAQCRSVVWVGGDPEQAWDVLAAAALRPPPRGTVVLVDDVDALTARLPEEYARAAGAAVECLVREAGARGIQIVATAQRLTGVAARVADLFPRRLILATAGRSEHAAAGGEPGSFQQGLPPGRGHLDGRLVQIAVASDAPEPPRAAPLPLWDPPEGLSAYVAPRARGVALERWERSGVRVRAVDAAEDPTAVGPGERVVVVGEADQWLSRPRLLERISAAAPMVVDAACARDLRLLTGERDLPPYADPGRARAWLYERGRVPRRVAVAPSP